MRMYLYSLCLDVTLENLHIQKPAGGRVRGRARIPYVRPSRSKLSVQRGTPRSPDSWARRGDTVFVFKYIKIDACGCGVFRCLSRHWSTVSVTTMPPRLQPPPLSPSPPSRGVSQHRSVTATARRHHRHTATATPPHHHTTTHRVHTVAK